jgi:chemotaxis protein methyltransferase CheR
MEDFRALQRSIERLLSIKCLNYKEDYIERRVLSRMRLSGKTGFKEYHSFLLSSPEEQELLRNALTINVTKFWRDGDVFGHIQKEIIPELLKRKSRVRIWSAGCATGEEPYSLALIIHDQISLKEGVNVTIYATDIDEVVLRRAKEGIYDKKSLENLNANQIRRHFAELPDGRYEVRPHLKKMIRFGPHDLMSGRPTTTFLDMILCRNVTIYFTERQKNDLVRMFHGALLNEGYYVMGKTEFLGREVEALFVPVNSLRKIYRKKAA